MTDKEKILEYLDAKGISKNAFYKQTGLSIGFLDSGNSLGVDKLRMITDNYHDFNYDWLITGEGDMLKDHNTTQERSPLELTNGELIPIFDLTANASVLDVFTDTNQMIPTGHLQIPGVYNCDGSLYLTGDSMHPLIQAGGIVAYRLLNYTGNIVWGDIHVVYIVHEGDEFFAVKYIERSEKEGWIRLVSYNDQYSPREFPMDSITQVAHVEAWVNFNNSMF